MQRFWQSARSRVFPLRAAPGQLLKQAQQAALALVASDGSDSPEPTAKNNNAMNENPDNFVCLRMLTSPVEESTLHKFNPE